jgi:hypothetical protein
LSFCYLRLLRIDFLSISEPDQHRKCANAAAAAAAAAASDAAAAAAARFLSQTNEEDAVQNWGTRSHRPRQQRPVFPRTAIRL